MTDPRDPLPPATAPLKRPVAAAAIAARLERNRAADGDKPTAAGTRLRCSDAWKCSRQIALGSTKVPKDIALTAKDLAIFGMGDFIHQGLQEALITEFGARCEVAADWTEAGLSLSGKADALYTWRKDMTKGLVGSGMKRFPTPGQKVLVEAKSMNGWGFKYCATSYNYKDGRVRIPGPRADHLVQAGLYALAPTIAAEWVHIVYVNKDTQDIAEWIIHLDQELEHLEGRTVRNMVAWETKRLAGILGRIDAGMLPARYVPDHGGVIAPSGEKSIKSHPKCAYCAWLPTCQALPMEAVEFTDLPEDKRPQLEETA